MSKFKQYLEGTWAIPQTADGYKNAISKIKSLQKELYNIIGDDILFDHLDGAIDRIKEIQKTALKEGKVKNE